MELGWGLSHQILPFVIYLLCVIGALLTVFYRLEIGLAIFLFFLPLQNVLNYAKDLPLGNDLNDLLLVAMMIRWFMNIRREDRPLLTKTPMNVPIILLLGWTFFGVVNSSMFLNLNLFSLSNPILVSWKNYLYMPLLYLIIANNVRDQKMIKILVLIMIFAMMVLDRNFYSIIKYRDNSHYSNTIIIIGTGMALSGNWLAIFLAQYSIIVLSLFMSDKVKYRRIFYGIVSAFSYYCVMFLFSRSGYLAAAGSIILLGLFRHRSLLLLAVVVLFMYQQVLPTAVQERIQMTRTEDGYDDTTMERLYMWEQAKSMIAEEPIIGRGFDFTSQMTIQIDGFANRAWHSFHNNYLQTLVEIGAIGLLLVLLVFLSGAYSGWLLYQQTEDSFFKGLGAGIMACFVAMLAGNIAGSYWQYYQIGGFYWAFVGLATGARLSVQAEATEQDESIEHNAALEIDPALKLS
jgi:putative inorganic carbon (hco3(-)) transporter